MGKKKSKTQKYKRNLKKKQNKTANKAATVLNTEVIYNVAITHPEILEKSKKKKEEQKKNRFSFASLKKFVEEKLLQKEVVLKKQVKVKKSPVKVTQKKKPLANKNTKSKENISKKKNIFWRLWAEITHNVHLFFNAILIICFLILLIGLIRVGVYSKGMIFYISILILFLMFFAISYSRYGSGKTLTILLCLGMGFAIYRLQYTYDFIRNLNTYKYEYKTYYVVSFDSMINKSIYNINNKKVGLLKTNSINIERMLNTKLDNVEYLLYQDVDDLFTSFYEQEFRAVIVNENQYKYLLSNENMGAKEVKILYEFKVNALKD